MGEEDYRKQGDRQPRSAAPNVTTGPVGAADERPWTALAHPGAFLNFFTLFLGPVAAFGVWLAYGERSPPPATRWGAWTTSPSRSSRTLSAGRSAAF